MVNSPESKTNKCLTCDFGLLMPDGNCWCSLNMRSCSNCSDNFNPGRAKLYKIVPKIVTPKQEARKIKRKEVKPKEVKQKIVTKKARAKPTQQRKLF